MEHDLTWLDHLSPEHRALVLAQTEQALTYKRLELYAPYTKQKLFHEAGLSYRERLLMAANQFGKTWAGGAEDALHATGRYPHWWRGRIFNKPTVGWVAGITGEKTRDGAQRVLMGRPNAIGTGMFPKDAIKDYSKKRGNADAIDTVVIRHGGGADVQMGESIRTFKSYDQGEQSFTVETLDTVWLDEEPPIKVYTEALTRTNTTNGLLWMTFTPLLGMSGVVTRFLLVDPSDPARHDRNVTSATIEDAEHYTAEQRARIIASYPEHEVEARTKGIPIMGSGRVFTVAESRIKCPAIIIPSHWPRIAAIDFGLEHPTAVVWMAWDRDADVIYVYDCYRVRKEPSIAIHASAINARGKWIPMAWPHDGNNDTAQGPQLAKQYRDHEVNMRIENAKFGETTDDSSVDTRQSRTSVEAGLQYLNNRMLTSRFKVFEHLNDWFEEYRLYHRKDGKVVKELDDLMSATRYAAMDLRYAITKPAGGKVDHGRAANWRL
jgi:phage terminase large subunit-like protein